MVVVAMLSLSACATQLRVVGPYASQLSKTDIQQITALVPPAPEINHTYTKLDAVGPREVRVSYMGYEISHGIPTDREYDILFTAVKRNGRWVNSRRTVF